MPPQPSHLSSSQIDKFPGSTSNNSYLLKSSSCLFLQDSGQVKPIANMNPALDVVEQVAQVL